VDWTWLVELLRWGAHGCGTAVTDDGGLMAGLFLTGLVGSLTHCTGMCGPFVLSQVAARLETRPVSQMREWHRLTGAALVPYHLGRATTYAGLGAGAAGVAGLLIGGGLRWLSAGLLVGAALAMLGMALPTVKRLFRAGTQPSAGAGPARESWWSRHVGRLVRPLFASPTGWRGWLLGVMLGFIPCGLLYGALAAAASSAAPFSAALAMLAFWAGTVPALFGVGVVGHMASRLWGGAVLRYAPLLLVLNAAVLSWMAWRLVTA
jgi:sulfite exporter TauE/SafE